MKFVIFKRTINVFENWLLSTCAELYIYLKTTTKNMFQFYFDLQYSSLKSVSLLLSVCLFLCRRTVAPQCLFVSL